MNKIAREDTKTSTSRLSVFIMLGYTIVLAVLGTIVRIGFAMTERGAASIAEGTSPLSLLMAGLVYCLPVSLVFLFVLIFLRRRREFKTIGSFVKIAFASSVLFCVLVIAYLALTRGAELATTVASHSVMLPILAVFAGIILWLMRNAFGIKTL